VLDALSAALATGKPTALTQAIAGLGGVGKTQTAIEFAYLHNNDYRYVLWARADSETSLISEFLKLAEQLNLPEKDARESAYAIAAVQRWLSTTEGYLLVLDNADEPDVLKPFLPVDPKGHILITTRAHHLEQCDPIPLEVMEPGEALDFLRQRARRNDSDPSERAAAERLAKELGYLPLALEQAAAYIAVSEVSFQDYLKEYEKLRLKLLADKHHQPRDYPASVLTTWTKSFEAVRQRSAAAADVLIVSAFLAPDGIPYEIFLKGASELGEALAAALADADGSEKPLYDLLTELRRYSLIRRHPDARTYDVHRLVQAVTRDGLDDPDQRLWAERAVRAVCKATPDIKFANWHACARLVPHWGACAGEIARHQMVFREAARLLNQAGNYLWERAQYQEAEPLLRHALAICEQALGADHPETARSLNNLAVLYRDQGRYAEAEPLFLRALAIRESALGPEHPNTGQSLNDLALLYRAQGRYAEAEPLYRRALEISESALGADHPHTATSLNNLALLYRAQGHYAEAELLYRRALAIYGSALGADHPEIATSLNNLGLLYHAQDRYDEAEPLLRQAHKIRESALGADHPDTAISLNNLAGLYRDQGRYAEAEPLSRRALAIFEQVLESDHPNMATFLQNLAYVLRKLGRGDEAKEMEARAQASREAHARRNAPSG
jgi:tetratricopeptide (TPR) repeat protein